MTTSMAVKGFRLYWWILILPHCQLPCWFISFFSPVLISYILRIVREAKVWISVSNSQNIFDSKSKPKIARLLAGVMRQGGLTERQERSWQQQQSLGPGTAYVIFEHEDHSWWAGNYFKCGYGITLNMWPQRGKLLQPKWLRQYPLVYQYLYPH